MHTTIFDTKYPAHLGHNCLGHDSMSCE